MTSFLPPFTLPHPLQDEGFSCLFLPETVSTNADALAALARGEDRVFIVAGSQSGGRGRHGRPWSSPQGNLYMSLALAEPAPPALAPLLGFVAGVSLAEAVLALAPGLERVLHLKWPNDLLLAGDKLSGLLLEGGSLPGGRRGVVIGIGVNIAGRPEGVDRSVALLVEHARGADAPTLFGHLARRLAANLALFAAGQGFAKIRARWLQLALPLGTPLGVKLPAGERHGVFAGLDEAGRLLLAQGDFIDTILVGDVFALCTPHSPEEALRKTP